MNEIQRKPHVKTIVETCKQCGGKVVAWTEDDLEFERMQHMYRAHPTDFAQSFVKAVPKVKQIGEAIGAFMRKYIQP